MTIVDRPLDGGAQNPTAGVHRARPAGRPVARPLSPAQRAVVVGLLIVTGLAAWLVVFLGPLSALSEQHAQSILYSQFRTQLGTFDPPPPPFNASTPLQPGDPVAVISAPTIGLRNVVVVEGTRSGDLTAGPGHWPGTPLPGEAGASYLLGRAFSYGGPFSAVPNLRTGAPITVTTGQGTYHFGVSAVLQPDQPIPARVTSTGSALVLVTATNHGWRNLWVPSHPVYVWATLKGKPAPDIATTIAVPADKPMTSDPSGLTVLVLWLQLLLVVAIGVTWAVIRWGGWQAWLIGCPVGLATLWGASLQFSHLLPNLL